MGELGCPFGNLAQEVSSIHEPLRLSLSAMFHALSEAMAECFEEGKEAGIFKASLPSKQLAEFAVAQVQGSFLLRKTHKEPDLMERNAEIMRQVLHQWMNN